MYPSIWKPGIVSPTVGRLSRPGKRCLEVIAIRRSFPLSASAALAATEPDRDLRDSGHRILQGLRRRAIADFDKFDARALGEVLANDALEYGRTVDRIMQLARAGARMDEELRKSRNRDLLGIHRDDERAPVGDHRDCRKILVRIIRQRLEQEDVGHNRARTREEEGVSIRGGARDRLRPDNVAGARHILDDHRLADPA
jgi:hypothetical protein